MTRKFRLLPAVILPAIALSSQASGDVVIGSLRGKTVGSSHPFHTSRRLDESDVIDEDNDEVIYDDEYDASGNNYTNNNYEQTNGTWAEVESEEVSNDDEDGERTSFVSKVNQYKEATAEKAWEFYESPPSEWSSSQWDFVTALLGGLFVTCCLASMACAHCCIYRDDEDNKHYGLQRRGNVSDRYVDHYKRYDDETTVASSYYDPISPRSMISEVTAGYSNTGVVPPRSMVSDSSVSGDELPTVTDDKKVSFLNQKATRWALNRGKVNAVPLQQDEEGDVSSIVSPLN